MPVIEIEKLTKDFQVGFWKKQTVRALDGLDLAVDRGEVFGFLGPNGAGKTTTLKILMNLIRATSGSARILGEPTGSVAMHRRIGFLPENPYFYDYLTPAEWLTYVGNLFGLRGKELELKVKATLEKVGLPHAASVQLRKFSKGMVQRIGIAQAIINDPEIVFLDEPMSGLDPLGRREVRQVIAGLKSMGVTVFFSSHILPDVEALCDRVAIMNRGRLQASGALNEILNIRIQEHEVILSGASGRLEEELAGKSTQSVQLGDRLSLRVASQAQVSELLALALSQGAELISVNPVRPSLEDYFVHEISGSSRQEAPPEDRVKA
jgi:ABC-2 type transport system ATP-binding protein